MPRTRTGIYLGRLQYSKDDAKATAHAPTIFLRVIRDMDVCGGGSRRGGGGGEGHWKIIPAEEWGQHLAHK
jgi:hypothetical protein